LGEKNRKTCFKNASGIERFVRRRFDAKKRVDSGVAGMAMALLGAERTCIRLF
jgi:hypothetical protein